MHNTPYLNCRYNPLTEDELLSSKHVEDIKIKHLNINLENVHFFGLSCTILIQCKVPKENINFTIQSRLSRLQQYTAHLKVFLIADTRANEAVVSAEYIITSDLNLSEHGSHSE
jgi:hypothetical protein